MSLDTRRGESIAAIPTDTPPSSVPSGLLLIKYPASVFTNISSPFL